jgi:hypothetical protein
MSKNNTPLRILSRCVTTEASFTKDLKYMAALPIRGITDRMAQH